MDHPVKNVILQENDTFVKTENIYIATRKFRQICVGIFIQMKCGLKKNALPLQLKKVRDGR